MPVLFFAFSRGRTEILAHELGREWDFLNDQEKKTVESKIREAEAEHPGTFSGPGWRNLRRLMLQGIASTTRPAAAGKIPGGKTVFTAFALGDFLHGNIRGRR